MASPSPSAAPRPSLRQILQPAVIVGALGYFVDIYDLILFSLVRVPSLKELGFTTQEQLTSIGLHLMNLQMIGMLAGGILFGVLAAVLLRVAKGQQFAFGPSLAVAGWLVFIANEKVLAALGWWLRASAPWNCARRWCRRRSPPSAACRRRRGRRCRRRPAGS